MSVVVLVYVFFSSRRRHTRCLIDWSSDVCSSDLGVQEAADRGHAEPAALGMSPIGGLLQPVGADEEGGLLVEIAAPGAPGRSLLAPVSAGLYRPVNVAGHRRLAAGEDVVLEGPGVLAFDGDRERKLVRGQRARLRVERSAPFVIEPERALRLAAERGAFLDRAVWHDAYDAR